MKSLVFFNNKGGVGKTTLTCNVVSYLNMSMGKRVLLVDADPQCNATQAILTEEECSNIYLRARRGRGSHGVSTLFDYLSPIEDGEPTIRENITPFLGSRNGYGTDLIPGHPRVSLIEDSLSGAWNQLNANIASGYRITNWCSQLLSHIESRYDLVVFDVGPSLGALNRTVILSSDFFVAPFGCDIFSLLGIQNISTWVKNWRRQYDRALSNIEDDRPGLLAEYPIVDDTDQKFRFAGYSVQQYVTKVFRTGRRPVAAYEQIMNMIPTTVEEQLDWLRPESIPKEHLSLGHIPFLYSLTPLSQSNRVPIHTLTDKARLVGTQSRQVENFRELMQSLCQQLLQNIGLA